jgi:hypothetical protein
LRCEMNYSDIMNALDMIWHEEPRLDILACRDQAYSLLNSVLNDFADYTWVTLNQQLEDLLDEFSEAETDAIEEAIDDSAGYGIDLYLGCVLGANGRLTASSYKAAETDNVLKAIEHEELQLQILERYELVPLILQDYSLNRLDDLLEQIPQLNVQNWTQIDGLRQGLMAVAITSFLIAAIHLENLYDFEPAKE